MNNSQLKRFTEPPPLFENKIVSANPNEEVSSIQIQRFEDLGFTAQEFLSTTEAAVFLRLLTKNGNPCVSRVRDLVSRGRIPFYKPFGRLLFKRSELKKYVESSRKGTLSVHK